MKIIKALLLLIFIFLVGIIGCSVYQIVQLNKTEVKIVEKVENIEDNKKDVILPTEEEKEEINEDLVKDDEIFKEVPIKEEVINIVLVGMDARSYEEKSEKVVTKKPAAKAKKPVAKKEIKTEIVLQYGEKEVNTKDMIAAVKKEWTKAKNKVSDIKSIELYVKPEDYAVYYVINGDTTGKIWL